jgi:AcrR family transcriptional regulator
VAWAASDTRGGVLTGRKADIREAALTLFAERGYHGTGMEDIAALVGIRASSLYNHVPSKQLLLVDIMRTTMQELLLGFDQAIAVAGEDDPRAGLRLAMEAHVRYHGTHRRDARIGNREIPSLEEPHQSAIRQQRRMYARRWQGLIEAGVAAGRFSTPSPQLSTYALLEMGIGVSQWFHEDGPLGLDEIAGHYGEMALRQLGADAGRRRVARRVDSSRSV